ncbi:MAG: hypothetical protein LCH96_18895 [Actinobacteria bacterium]|nr:hypothetical protein [Actinomycetota bacterium]
MKALTAAFTAVILVLGLGLGGGVLVAPQAALAAGANPVPEATKKKTPKPTRSATPTPTPTSTGRTPAQIEGDRWIQLAVIVGGGLIGSVLVFFLIGALLRRRPRRRD